MPVGSPSPARSRRKARVERSPWPLVAVVAAATLVAAVWAFFVPPFEQPDELAHVDYAFALYDVARPFQVADAMPASLASAQGRYLEAAVAYRSMRYNPAARSAGWFFSADMRHRVDTGAPRPSHAIPPHGARLPYVMFIYPVAYYVLAAAATVAAGWATSSSLVAEFLTLRLLNVALFAGTTYLSYLVIEAYLRNRRASLLVTFAVALFPLASWVGAYVQPDNLTSFLYAATSYAAVRWLRTPYEPIATAAIALCLAILFFTKQHYAIAMWIPIVAMMLANVPRVKRSRAIGAFAGLILIVPIVAAIASFRLTPVASLVDTQNVVRQNIATALEPSAFGALCRAFAREFVDVFVGGDAFDSFWFRFGIRGATIFPSSIIPSLRAGLVLAGTIVFTLLTVVSIRRYTFVWRHKRRPTLARIVRTVVSNVPFNAYLAVMLVELIAATLSSGRLTIQGRYWLPAILGITIAIFAGLPRLVPPVARRRATVSLAACAALWSAGSSATALFAMGRNFYGTPPPSPRFSTVAGIDGAIDGHGITWAPDAINLRAPSSLRFSGYALDTITGLPATQIAMRIDGRTEIRIARLGIARPELAALFHDDAIRTCGFEGTVPSELATKGSHTVTFLVRQRNGREAPFHQTIRFDVRGAAPQVRRTLRPAMSNTRANGRFSY